MALSPVSIMRHRIEFTISAFRRLSVAYEYAKALRWKRRHLGRDASDTRPTVGEMLPQAGQGSKPATVDFKTGHEARK
jgi:hypothetical protein